MNTIKLLAIAFQNGKGNCYKPLVILKAHIDGRLALPGLPFTVPTWDDMNSLIIESMTPGVQLEGSNLLTSKIISATVVQDIDTFYIAELAVIRNDAAEAEKEFVERLAKSPDYKIVPFETIERMKDEDFYEGHKVLLLGLYGSLDASKLGIWRDAS